MTILIYLSNDIEKISKVVTQHFFYKRFSKVFYEFYGIEPSNHYEYVLIDKTSCFEFFDKKKNLQTI